MSVFLSLGSSVGISLFRYFGRYFFLPVFLSWARYLFRSFFRVSLWIEFLRSLFLDLCNYLSRPFVRSLLCV